VGKDFENDPAEGEDRQEKDTFLTEQTERSIENKGLSFFRGQKQTAS
jgi:hypothetical protein